MHDGFFVGAATNARLPDWLVNIPSMIPAYSVALITKILRTFWNSRSTGAFDATNFVQMSNYLNHGKILRASIALTLFTVISVIFYGLSYANEDLRPGNRYKIVRSVYLMAVYNSLNNKQLSKETARAYLHSKRYYKKSWVAFQCEVPAGTIMTIIGPAPKVWSLPFFVDRYFVQLDPDLSRGLDVVLELDRGIEGSLDGLNPELFSRQ
jgi:hypothetical protein